MRTIPILALALFSAFAIAEKPKKPPMPTYKGVPAAQPAKPANRKKWPVRGKPARVELKNSAGTTINLQQPVTFKGHRNPLVMQKARTVLGCGISRVTLTRDHKIKKTGYFKADVQKVIAKAQDYLNRGHSIIDFDISYDCQTAAVVTNKTAYSAGRNGIVEEAVAYVRKGGHKVQGIALSPAANTDGVIVLYDKGAFLARINIPTAMRRDLNRYKGKINDLMITPEKHAAGNMGWVILTDNYLTGQPYKRHPDLGKVWGQGLARPDYVSYKPGQGEFVAGNAICENTSTQHHRLRDVPSCFPIRGEANLTVERTHAYQYPCAAQSHSACSPHRTAVRQSPTAKQMQIIKHPTTGVQRPAKWQEGKPNWKLQVCHQGVTTPLRGSELKIGVRRFPIKPDCSVEFPWNAANPKAQITLKTNKKTFKHVVQLRSKDIWVVILGDSYASGEGAPLQNSKSPNHNAKWLHDRARYVKGKGCHMSPAAWGFHVAEKLAARLKASGNGRHGAGVEVTQLACSGAKLGDDADFEKVGKGQAKKDGYVQFGLLEDEIAKRGYTPDLVLMSIGGNDAHFSRVLKQCMAFGCEREVLTMCTNASGPDKWVCEKLEEELGDQYLRDILGEAEAELAKLPARFDLLNTKLKGLGITSDKVVLASYYDAFRDARGQVKTCVVFPRYSAPINDINRHLQDSFDCRAHLEQRDGKLKGGYAALAESTVGVADIKAATRRIADPLFNIQKAAAAKHGWTFVDDIAKKAFWGRGVCSARSSVNTMCDSILSMKSINGAYHPNRAGHAAVGAVVWSKIKNSRAVSRAILRVRRR